VDGKGKGPFACQSTGSPETRPVHPRLPSTQMRRYAPRPFPFPFPAASPLLGPGPAAEAALVGRPLRGVVCVDLRRDGPAWVVLVAIRADWEATRSGAGEEERGTEQRSTCGTRLGACDAGLAGFGGEREGQTARAGRTEIIQPDPFNLSICIVVMQTDRLTPVHSAHRPCFSLTAPKPSISHHLTSP
jgi:hypothetical protein